VELADLPAFGRPARLVWCKHRWRCLNPGCSVRSWTGEDRRIAASRLHMAVPRKMARARGLPMEYGRSRRTITDPDLPPSTRFLHLGAWSTAETLHRRHQRTLTAFTATAASDFQAVAVEWRRPTEQLVQLNGSQVAAEGGPPHNRRPCSTMPGNVTTSPYISAHVIARRQRIPSGWSRTRSPGPGFGRFAAAATVDCEKRTKMQAHIHMRIPDRELNLSLD